MTVLITADVHFNLKPQDNYRWGLIDWLLQQKADELLILGDLTDAKDHHSAILTNRMHKEINKLKDKFKRVYILKGNHDYLTDEHTPFFKFLDDESNITRSICFITEPKIIGLTIGRATFVPAGARWGTFQFHTFPYVFTHATFSGAKAENGITLTGVDPKVLDGYDGIVYSGDIHSPQELANGKIRYIGAPYHTRFGDSFNPRVLCISNDDVDKELYYPAPRKHVFSISHPDDLLEYREEENDHVKIKCYLKRAEYVNWKSYKDEIRKICNDKKWLLFGCELIPVELQHQDGIREKQAYKSTEELMLAYAKNQKATKNHITLGKELLNVR